MCSCAVFRVFFFSFSINMSIAYVNLMNHCPQLHCDKFISSFCFSTQLPLFLFSLFFQVSNVLHLRLVVYVPLTKPQRGFKPSPGPEGKAEIRFLTSQIQFLFPSWVLQMDRKNPPCIKQQEVVMPIADEMDRNRYDTEKYVIFSSFLFFSALIPLRL